METATKSKLCAESIDFIRHFSEWIINLKHIKFVTVTTSTIPFLTPTVAINSSNKLYAINSFAKTFSRYMNWIYERIYKRTHRAHIAMYLAQWPVTCSDIGESFFPFAEQINLCSNLEQHSERWTGTLLTLNFGLRFTCAYRIVSFLLVSNA